MLGQQLKLFKRSMINMPREERNRIIKCPIKAREGRNKSERQNKRNTHMHTRRKRQQIENRNKYGR